MQTSDRTWEERFARWPANGHGSLDVYSISSGRHRLDLQWMLSNYRSAASDEPLSKAGIDAMLDSSSVFGLYHKDAAPGSPDQSVYDQIGMARIITSSATTVLLSDILVDAEYRNMRLEAWLIRCCITAIKEGSRFKRVMLDTNSLAFEDIVKLCAELQAQAIKQDDSTMVLLTLS